jgi:AraC-like DNA-binding protein
VAGHLFHVSPTWRAMLADLDVATADVLRVAGLPPDLFARASIDLTTGEYYALWRAVEAVSGDSALPVRLAQVARTETFDPPLVAGLLSDDLRAGADRIAAHKRLMGPLRLVVEPSPSGLDLTLEWPPGPPPPPVLVLAELVLWVLLARIGTRTRVVPRRLTMPDPPDVGAQAPYVALLGVAIEAGATTTASFTELDAHRPFLTADPGTLRLLEPVLAQLLAEHDAPQGAAAQVRALLVEMLPAGVATMRRAAARLGVSPRTLQRRLADDGTSFAALLEETRQRLAAHYLADPSLPVAEIAFLLGYDEPRSFYRAHRSWSGTTPGAVRRAGRRPTPA